MGHIAVIWVAAGIAEDTSGDSVVRMAAAEADWYCTRMPGVVDIAEVERIVHVVEVGCTADIVDTGIAGGTDTAALAAPCFKDIKYLWQLNPTPTRANCVRQELPKLLELGQSLLDKANQVT